MVGLGECKMFRGVWMGEAGNIEVAIKTLKKETVEAEKKSS